jgi:dipeptidyl aminopeptidase/acylaminoacyl peptidase
MRYFLFFGFLFLTFWNLSQNVLTPELLWQLKRVSGGTVSPDGNFLLYSQRSFNMSENSGNTDLFVIDLKTGKNQQITHTTFSEMEAQWGKNNMIWFMSSEPVTGLKSMQIWKIKADGSEKTRCSDFKDIQLEGFKLSPNEDFIVTIEAVKMKPTVQDKYPDLPKANARIEDDLMYRHWDQWDDFHRSHLFIHSIANGKISSVGKDINAGEVFDAVIPPFGGTDQFCISSDSKTIIYTSKKLQGIEFARSTNSDLYAYSIETGKVQNLTSGYMGYDNHPNYSSNGALAWLSMARNGFEADKNDLIIRDADGKDINLTAELDITIDAYEWHPDGKRIFVLSPTKGTVQIFEIDIASKKMRQVTSGQHNYVSISIHGDRIFAGRQSMIEPTDLYAIGIKKGDIKQLTKANEDLLKNITLPTVQEKWITTTDGKQMLVWMVLPPNMVSSKQYPALLYCQGGPQSMVSQFFSYRWNLALMASEGYVVVAPNRRGLPGFGQEWNDAISLDWGGQAMRDYISATDEAAKLPYVDKNRMGAVGASYGGYSVYMLAGIHEKRFKTFISHCGLFNLESWYGTTEELFFADWDHGGPYWLPENKENYEKNSPHKYVANWDTPLLVIHGGVDFRVPESEGMQAFQAARLKGLRSKYLLFPTEGHWVQRPQNGLLWQREFFEWLQNDLKK